MAEHSAVNRRVVGSSPTWGVKTKEQVIDLLFVFTFKFRHEQQTFIEQLNRLLTASHHTRCRWQKEGVMGWRSGLQQARFIRDCVGHRKLIGCPFEPGLGINKRRPPNGGLFCYSFKLDSTHTLHRNSYVAVNCITTRPPPVEDEGRVVMAQRVDYINDQDRLCPGTARVTV